MLEILLPHFLGKMQRCIATDPLDASASMRSNPRQTKSLAGACVDKIQVSAHLWVGRHFFISKKGKSVILFFPSPSLVRMRRSSHATFLRHLKNGVSRRNDWIAGTSAKRSWPIILPAWMELIRPRSWGTAKARPVWFRTWARSCKCTSHVQPLASCLGC